MSSCAGLVLAGGASSRMGTAKAFLDWKGEPLWRRQVRVLSEAGADPVILSGPRCVEWQGHLVVQDERPGLGPLAGIISGLRQGLAPFLLVLAVDLPRMNVATLSQLIQRAKPEGGAVFRGAEGFEPLAACYSQALLPEMEEELRCGRGAPHVIIERWVRDAKMTVLPVLEKEVWTNVNSMEEWEEAQKLA